MKKILIGLLLATLLLGCTQMSAEQIAKQMQKKYSSIKDMKGTMVVTEPGKVYSFSFEKKGNKWRIDGRNGTTVCNGSVTWMYDKQSNKYRIMGATKLVILPFFDYERALKYLLEKYKLKLLGEERVSGRDCYVIEAKPKEESYYLVKLWVDKEFWYPIKIEVNHETHSGSNRTYTIEYRDVKFNTGIPDKEFEFVPPEGAKMVRVRSPPPPPPPVLTIEQAQKRVNFTIIRPKYTAGYNFSYAKIRYNSQGVTLYYKKGDKVFSIEELPGANFSAPNATKVKIGGIEGGMSDIFGNRMLIFHVNGVEVFINAVRTSGLSEKEIVRIAESMV